MRTVVIGGLLALILFTAGCVGGLFDPGGTRTGLVDDARTSVERTMDTVNHKIGGTIWACPGISTVFQKTCHFHKLEGERLEGYLAKSGWKRTPSDAALQGFARDGILITYEKIAQGLAVTVRKH